MVAVRSSRGVSLIEALVALAVMAFGLLGVVGMQSTLRVNADVSRQRAEAVRMAQERMEDLRAFGVLDGSTVGEHDFNKIVDAIDIPATFAGTNANFNRITTVTEPAPPAGAATAPDFRTVQVRVEWLDRRTAAGGTAEAVTLTSNIARVSPALGASLGLPGDQSGPARPQGRHARLSNLPNNRLSVIDGLPGFIKFQPKAGVDVYWTIKDSTGEVVECPTLPTPCTALGWLLNGYIRFATGLDPATYSEDPPSSATLLGVKVTLTSTTEEEEEEEEEGSTLPTCYSESVFSNSAVAYYCLVPTGTSPTGTSLPWSGTSKVTETDGTDLSTLATDATTDSSATRWRVCRYSPSATETLPEKHPATYTAVAQYLSNQNFLIISAGNGSVVYSCPGDGPDTRINTNTVLHQPAP